jgi:hypothetical protein
MAKTLWMWFGISLLAVFTGVLLGLLSSPPPPSWDMAQTDQSGSNLDQAPLGAQGIPDGQPAQTVDLAERLGIEISSLHLAVAGTRISFRYRVTDPLRATRLTNWVNSAYLVDATGHRLSQPHAPKGVPLRSESGQQLRADRIYSHFFPNVGGRIKSGDAVTLVVGNLRAENLIVH